jgi:hypothetical protein
MRYLYENPTAGRELGERARAHLASRFSLAAVGEKIRDAVRDRMR